jgi:hypothetical protein
VFRGQSSSSSDDGLQVLLKLFKNNNKNTKVVIVRGSGISVSAVEHRNAVEGRRRQIWEALNRGMRCRVFTGKILPLLATTGRRVVALDVLGQNESIVYLFKPLCYLSSTRNCSFFLLVVSTSPASRLLFLPEIDFRSILNATPFSDLEPRPVVIDLYLLIAVPSLELRTLSVMA